MALEGAGCKVQASQQVQAKRSGPMFYDVVYASVKEFLTCAAAAGRLCSCVNVETSPLMIDQFSKISQNTSTLKGKNATPANAICENDLLIMRDDTQ